VARTVVDVVVVVNVIVVYRAKHRRGDSQYAPLQRLPSPQSESPRQLPKQLPQSSPT
jgi:hypothetical protein